jgi:hypothetical protein
MQSRKLNIAKGDPVEVPIKIGKVFADIDNCISTVRRRYEQFYDERGPELSRLVSNFDLSQRKHTFDNMPSSILISALEEWPFDLVLEYLWSLEKLKGTNLLDELSPEAKQSILKTYKYGQDKLKLSQYPKKDEIGSVVGAHNTVKSLSRGGAEEQENDDEESSSDDSSVEDNDSSGNWSDHGCSENSDGKDSGSIDIWSDDSSIQEEEEEEEEELHD